MVRKLKFILPAFLLTFGIIVCMCKSIYSIDPNKFLFGYTAKIKYATTSSLLLVGSYIESTSNQNSLLYKRQYPVIHKISVVIKRVVIHLGKMIRRNSSYEPIPNLPKDK